MVGIVCCNIWHHIARSKDGTSLPTQSGSILASYRLCTAQASFVWPVDDQEPMIIHEAPPTNLTSLVEWVSIGFEGVYLTQVEYAIKRPDRPQTLWAWSFQYIRRLHFSKFGTENSLSISIEPLHFLPTNCDPFQNARLLPFTITRSRGAIHRGWVQQAQARIAMPEGRFLWPSLGLLKVLPLCPRPDGRFTTRCSGVWLPNWLIFWWAILRLRVA